ncbi:hypothetical protein GCM10020000_24970 [Streptomyces olivoverticillatus]
MIAGENHHSAVTCHVASAPGMSPFGGNATDEAWNRVDPRLFLQGPMDELSRTQAAFRVAYCLPSVGTVAVGSDNPAHLRELLDARRYEVDSQTVRQYRDLLQGRAQGHPACSSSTIRAAMSRAGTRRGSSG